VETDAQGPDAFVGGCGGGDGPGRRARPDSAGSTAFSGHAGGSGPASPSAPPGPAGAEGARGSGPGPGPSRAASGARAAPGPQAPGAVRAGDRRWRWRWRVIRRRWRQRAFRRRLVGRALRWRRRLVRELRGWQQHRRGHDDAPLARGGERRRGRVAHACPAAPGGAAAAARGGAARRLSRRARLRPAARARAARRRRCRPAADAARRRAGAGHPRQAGVAAGTPRAAQCTLSRTQRRLWLSGRERRDERARERNEPARRDRPQQRQRRARDERRPCGARRRRERPRRRRDRAHRCPRYIARVGAARLREWRQPPRVGDRDQPVGRGGADAARRPRRLRHPVAARPAPRGPAGARRTSATGQFHSALRSAAPA
jgi:hypothetical protein